MATERFRGKATEVLGSRVPRDVKKEVEKRSAAEGRSASSWVLARVRAALESEAPPAAYPPAPRGSSR